MAKKKEENGDENEGQSLGVPATMRPELVTFKIIGLSPLLQNNPAEFIGKEEDTSITAGRKVYDDNKEASLRGSARV